MLVSFDPEKRALTLQQRGLDFADAYKVFQAKHFTAPDLRQEYAELRNITIGYLDDRMVVIVWTKRDDSRRIISMRKANEREIKKFSQYLG